MGRKQGAVGDKTRQDNTTQHNTNTNTKCVPDGEFRERLSTNCLPIFCLNIEMLSWILREQNEDV
jgi:hypothetical protein